jgi:hypothetical protein
VNKLHGVIDDRPKTRDEYVHTDKDKNCEEISSSFIHRIIFIPLRKTPGSSVQDGLYLPPDNAQCTPITSIRHLTHHDIFLFEYLSQLCIYYISIAILSILISLGCHSTTYKQSNYHILFSTIAFITIINRHYVFPYHIRPFSHP